jgi:hypothetical protein
MDRITTTSVDSDGEELPVDTTWLVVDDWPGPTVWGWRGGLDRMRWAVDPLDNWFTFAAA